MPIKPVARAWASAPDGPAIHAESQGESHGGEPTGAGQAGPVRSSRRGRASPFSALARNPPSGRGDKRCPSSVCAIRKMIGGRGQGVITPNSGVMTLPAVNTDKVTTGCQAYVPGAQC